MNLTRSFFKYITPFLHLTEFLFFRKYTSKADYSPIFIIGAPRSGSTILYQLITNYFSILYTSNLVHYCFRNFFMGFIIHHYFYGNKTHNSFNSEYGDTSKDSLLAPSECSNFWYKYFPNKNIPLPKEEISNINLEKLRYTINKVINHFKKPIIFKNLNNSNRIEVLLKTFPNAKFIVIKRDIFYNAQSVLMARKNLNYPSNKIWSIKPLNYKEIENEKNEYDIVIKQIQSIENQIEKILNNSNTTFLLVEFEKLISKPIEVLNQVQSFCNLEEKKEINLKDLNIKDPNIKKLSSKEINELEKTILKNKNIG